MTNPQTKLKNLRAKISRLDLSLISILEKRFLTSAKIAQVKKLLDLNILDKSQEHLVTKRFKTGLSKTGVSSSVALKLSRLILEESKRVQKRSLKKASTKSKRITSN